MNYLAESRVLAFFSINDDGELAMGRYSVSMRPVIGWTCELDESTQSEIWTPVLAVPTGHAARPLAHQEGARCSFLAFFDSFAELNQQFGKVARLTFAEYAEAVNAMDELESYYRESGKLEIMPTSKVSISVYGGKR